MDIFISFSGPGFMVVKHSNNFPMREQTFYKQSRTGRWFVPSQSLEIREGGEIYSAEYIQEEDGNEGWGFAEPTNTFITDKIVVTHNLSDYKICDLLAVFHEDVEKYQIHIKDNDNFFVSH